jgi:type IV pilus assembly protein PilM
MMEKINTKDIKNYRILVLAVHNNLLMTYYELAEQLKLKIDSIDYVGNSVYQIYQKQIDQGTNMVVQVNEQNTMINVMQKKVLELQRIIPYGYDTVINTILDHTNDKITKADEAFHQLRDKPLIQPRFVDYHHDFYQEEGMPASTKQEELLHEITNSLQYLVNNIMRVVDYYVSKKPDAKLQTIYLTGMGAKLNGIEKLFANEIGIEVKILDVLQGVTFVQPINIENYAPSDFIACAGATIEPVGMQPAKYAIRETYKNNLVAVVTISSLAILTSLLLWFISDRAVKEAEEEKERLLAQITEMESIDTIYTDNLRISEELETIKGLEDLSYSSNEALVSLITEMELKLPSNVIIHSMTAGASGIVMNITADSKETAAMTLMQLKTISNLSEVTTSGISEQMDEYGVTEINFSVLAMYSIPEQDGGEIN